MRVKALCDVCIICGNLQVFGYRLIMHTLLFQQLRRLCHPKCYGMYVRQKSYVVNVSPVNEVVL